MQQVSQQYRNVIQGVTLSTTISQWNAKNKCEKFGYGDKATEWQGKKISEKNQGMFNGKEKNLNMVAKPQNGKVKK